MFLNIFLERRLLIFSHPGGTMVVLSGGSGSFLSVNSAGISSLNLKLLIKNAFFYLRDCFFSGNVYFCSPFWGSSARLVFISEVLFF